MHEIDDALHGERSGLGGWIADEPAAFALVEREIDLAGWVIVAMEKFGLVWNVVRITPERQAQKISVRQA